MAARVTPWSGCWLIKGVFPLSFKACSLSAPFPSSFNAFARGARLLQETFRCFPHAMSFLHSCQFTLCVPLLASILCHQSSKNSISIRFKAELKFLHKYSRVFWLWMEPFFTVSLKPRGPLCTQSQVLRALQKPGYLPFLFKSRRVASLIDCKLHLLDILYNLKWTSVIQIN